MLDLVPADRLGRTPWPGVSVSAVYPYPPNNISLVSTSARANEKTDTSVDGQVATIKGRREGAPLLIRVRPGREML